MDVTVKQTPAEIASLFGAMTDDDQAEFFNALHAYVLKEYPEGLFGFSVQMAGVMRRPQLKATGETIMRFIGGHY